MNFGRMPDHVKQDMHAKYSADPIEWNVAKLATVYGFFN